MHLFLSTYNLSLYKISQSKTLLTSKKKALSCTHVFCLKVVDSNVSSTKFRAFKLVLFCMSFTCFKNNRGPKTEPYGTPISTFSQVETNPLKLINCFISVCLHISEKLYFTTKKV